MKRSKKWTALLLALTLLTSSIHGFAAENDPSVSDESSFDAHSSEYTLSERKEETESQEETDTENTELEIAESESESDSPTVIPDSQTCTGEHRWDSGELTETATCSKEGSIRYVCLDCQETKITVVSKNPTIHNHIEVLNQKDPTVAEEGYTGDTYCTDCHTLLKEGSIIEPLANVPDVQNLTAKAAGKNKVRLTWDPIEDVDGYLIYAQKNGKYSYLSMTTSGCTYIDSKALDTDYNFYWVFGFIRNAEGKMITGGCTHYVYAKGLLNPVTQLTASCMVTGVKLSWKAAPEAAGYLIYGYHGSPKSGATYGYIGMTGNTSFTDTKAVSGDYNFYWVFPYIRSTNNAMVAGQTPEKYVYSHKHLAETQDDKDTKHCNFCNRFYEKVSGKYLMQYYDLSGQRAYTAVVTDGKAVMPDHRDPMATNDTFMGWSKSAGASVAAYKPGETVSVSANTELYPVIFNRQMETLVDRETFLNNYKSTGYDYIYFIGDSRTFIAGEKLANTSDLADVINKDHIFTLALSGSTYKWFKNTASNILNKEVSKIRQAQPKAKIAIVFNHGVNEIYAANRNGENLNTLKNGMRNYMTSTVVNTFGSKGYGCDLYYMSLNPIGAQTYRTSAEVIEYNQFIQTNVCNGEIKYIDMYNQMMTYGFAFDSGVQNTDTGLSDSTHYSSATYRRIMSDCFAMMHAQEISSSDE